MSIRPPKICGLRCGEVNNACDASVNVVEMRTLRWMSTMKHLPMCVFICAKHIIFLLCSMTVMIQWVNSDLYKLEALALQWMVNKGIFWL